MERALDYRLDSCRIGMAEILRAVGADQEMPGIDQVHQRFGDIVPAAVVGDFYRIDLKPCLTRWDELFNGFGDDGVMGVGEEEAAFPFKFRQEGDTGPVGFLS